MLRWSFHLLAAFSLLLFLATLFLWIRSHTMTDDIYWYTENRMTRFRTSGGGFWFETRPWPYRFSSSTVWHRFYDKALYPLGTTPSSPLHQRLGFLIDTRQYDLLLLAPYWSLAALSAPMPLLWIRSTIRQRRRRWRLAHNLCPTCAYDLRESPTKCPECGTPSPSPTSTFSVRH